MKKIFYLFLLFFLFSCSNSYTEFHETKNIYEKQKTRLKQELSEFKLENIRNYENKY